MQAHSDALSRVQEDAAWFARATELRLLVVRASGDMRKPVLFVLRGMECHADNRSPWDVLEDPHTGLDARWLSRAGWLAKAWRARRDAFAREGTSLPDIADPSQDVSVAEDFRLEGTDLRAFGRVVAEVLTALRSPLRGLVIVLAPTHIDDPETLERELLTLIHHPKLSEARWVLVADVAAGPFQALSDHLGRRMILSDGVVPADQAARDIDALLASPSESFGLAVPRGVVPPPRVGDPPPPTLEQLAQRDEALQKAGVPLGLMGPDGLRLREVVLGAAVAMGRGKGAQALTLQREAVALCERIGLGDALVITQITLATYLAGQDRGPEALVELGLAIAAARQRGLPTQEAQAQLACGLLHALGGDARSSMDAYAGAADAATRAGSPLLAIESFRLGAQIAFQGGWEEEGRTFLEQALQRAYGAEPVVVQQSSAPEAARQLATWLRGEGLDAQATSLFQQADAMERGQIGAVPAGAA